MRYESIKSIVLLKSEHIEFWNALACFISIWSFQNLHFLHAWIYIPIACFIANNMRALRIPAFFTVYIRFKNKSIPIACFILIKWCILLPNISSWRTDSLMECLRGEVKCDVVVLECLQKWRTCSLPRIHLHFFTYDNICSFYTSIAHTFECKRIFSTLHKIASRRYKFYFFFQIFENISIFSGNFGVKKNEKRKFFSLLENMSVTYNDALYGT